MDLSIIERALRFRDEAQKAQLGDNAPDVSPLSRGENGRMEQPAGLPDDKIAVELMGRALAFIDEMNKVIDPGSGPASDPQSAADVADLLAAATAPLPVFDDSELANVGQPPVVSEPPVVAQPPVVSQPPVREPPVREPPVREPPVREPPVREPPVREPPIVAQPPIMRPPIPRPPILSPIGDVIEPTGREPRDTTPPRPPAKRTAPKKKKGGARKKKPKRDDEQ